MLYVKDILSGQASKMALNGKTVLSLTPLKRSLALTRLSAYVHL